MATPRFPGQAAATPISGSSSIIRCAYVGDPVAAVAATDRHIAEDALKLIEVKYEKLPHVLDPNEALKPDAPKIAPNGNLSVGKGAFSAPIEESWGDVEQGFKEADRVFEDTYITKHVNNAQLERRVSIAKWDAGKLTVYASTQGVSNARTDIAKDFGLPLSKVRVVCKYMGGGFGNKNQAQDYDYMAAMLAKVAAQPVKLEFTREDDYIGMHGRWSSEQHYKIGVKKDGTITAVIAGRSHQYGRVPQAERQFERHRFLSDPQLQKTHQAGAHQHRGRRQLSRAGLSAVGVRLRVVPGSDRPSRWGSIRSTCSCATGFRNIKASCLHLELSGAVHHRRRQAHRLEREMA